MTTKLSICLGALRLMKGGSVTQSELTNNSREPARLFNAIWDDGGLNACLEAGQWKFAKRVAMIDSSPSVPPGFEGGYQFAFDKPADFVRTMGVWMDAGMTTPLSTYREEGAGLWWASLDPIYVAYVSNDPAYGLDYSLWPQSFVSFTHAHFACEMVGPLTSQGVELLKVRRMRLSDALSTDAMADPTKRMPAGSWVRSRGAAGRSWPDGNPR